MRSTDSVRIWLILIHDRFGRPPAWLSSVNGNAALGSWLVIATAITVPERSLNTSWLRIRTGRRPACSCPRTGFSFAHRTSPRPDFPREGHVMDNGTGRLPGLRPRWRIASMLRRRVLVAVLAALIVTPLLAQAP